MQPFKTEAGLQVLKDRSVPLTPRQRAAFILVDGKRSLADVLQATAPSGVTREDVDQLFTLGLIAHEARAAQRQQQAATASGKSDQERYAQAYPVAAKLTSGLGLRGFRLNLAVEAATCLDDLIALAPKIREAVGADKFAPLHAALSA
jgi:hypothetical protein